MAVQPLKKLGDQHHRFITYYLEDLNAARAARRAGYSEKTAKWIGHQLLNDPLLSTELKRRQDDLAKHLHINLELVLREYCRIAFAALSHIAEWEEGGSLRFKASEDLSADEAAAICELTTVTRTLERDDVTLTTVTAKAKMHNKLKALDMIIKVLALVETDDDEDESGKGLAALLEAARVLRGEAAGG